MPVDTSMQQLVSLSQVDTQSVEHLLDLAFGADRFGRTAYRLRTKSVPIPPLSFAIVEDDRLVASIQCWPVRIDDCRMVLVGPVAVRPDYQNLGLGRRLMQTMLEQAKKIGNPPMVMIGDPEYYNRYGFSAELTGGWSLPGPWEPRRLLASNIGMANLPSTGMLEEDGDAL